MTQDRQLRAVNVLQALHRSLSLLRLPKTSVIAVSLLSCSAVLNDVCDSLLTEFAYKFCGDGIQIFLCLSILFFV